MKKISNEILQIALGLMLLMTAGCNLPSAPESPVAPGPVSGAPSPVPSLPSGEDCLVGTWELNDFADAIQGMLPDTVKYKGTSGKMRWTFTAGGIVEATSDGFTITIADEKPPAMEVSIRTNGTARRFYRLAGAGVLDFWNPDDSEFTYTGTINGQPITLDLDFEALVPVPPADGELTYQFQANGLTIIPAKAGTQPLGFSKVGR